MARDAELRPCLRVAQGMHPGMLPPGAVPMPMTGEWTEGGMYYPFYYTDYS